MPLLHHRRITAGPDRTPERSMLVLHGIFGAGRNWHSVARRFVDARPDWSAILVDLRQHGESMGFAPPHNLEACAADVAALVHATGANAAAILGHSFGGKVAMVYARHPATPLDHVWVADSTPDARPPAGSAWAMLGVLRNHPGPFPDRSAGVQAIRSEGFDDGVARWMSTNLVDGEGGGLVWRLDPDEMEALLRSFFATDTWDVVERPPGLAQVHVIKASESSILTDEACARIESAGAVNGGVQLHRVQSGHWLNADNPDALHRLLVEHAD